jgi:hypothetical protein
MSGKKRPPKRQTARRTAGEGVPRTRREGSEPAERKARPERGSGSGSARLDQRRRPTARDREGL